jgi:hypothetical protein
MPIDIWHEVNDEPQPRTKIALATSLVVFLGSACASSAGCRPRFRCAFAFQLPFPQSSADQTRFPYIAGWLGPTNADVSQKYPTPLTPASWAFGIWSIIFILQTIGVGIVLLGREDPDGARQRHANAVSGPWVGGWLSASAWQVAFVQETPLSMWVAAVLLSMSLACLVTGLVRLYRQRRYFGSPGSVLLYSAFFLPTSVMAAWLSGRRCITQISNLWQAHSTNWKMPRFLTILTCFVNPTYPFTLVRSGHSASILDSLLDASSIFRRFGLGSGYPCHWRRFVGRGCPQRQCVWSDAFVGFCGCV